MSVENSTTTSLRLKIVNEHEFDKNPVSKTLRRFTKLIDILWKNFLMLKLLKSIIGIIIGSQLFDDKSFARHSLTILVIVSR